MVAQKTIASKASLAAQRLSRSTFLQYIVENRSKIIRAPLAHKREVVLWCFQTKQLQKGLAMTSYEDIVRAITDKTISDETFCAMLFELENHPARSNPDFANSTTPEFKAHEKKMERFRKKAMRVRPVAMEMFRQQLIKIIKESKPACQCDREIQNKE